MRTGLERHHLYPRYRIKHPTVKVEAPDHQLYHKVFGVNTPDEILDWLVEKVWGGRLDVLKQYFRRKSHEEHKRLANSS